jgi:hypothetical protein
MDLVDYIEREGRGTYEGRVFLKIHKVIVKEKEIVLFS